jgi:D-alanine-D-alanine ligase
VTQKNIAIVYGGFSAERVISEKSAELVHRHLDPAKYRSFMVDIAREGWSVHHEGQVYPVDKTDFSFQLNHEHIRFDGVFNAIHGTPGEDGKLQGYFDVMNIPYNNCGVIESAISFNKAACNIYLGAFGINVAKSRMIRRGHAYDADAIVNDLGLPCFVKPTDGGSSIGITKVKLREEFDAAVLRAQEEGSDVIAESFLDGVEVSCGCISIQGKPKALAVTEIVPANDFFDFDSKYTNAKTQEITPARIEKEVYDEIMKTTERIYGILNGKGMIRIDFMVCKDGIYLIEPNTTPGLSEASILPQQAVYAGYDLDTFFDLSVVEMFQRHSARS